MFFDPRTLPDSALWPSIAIFLAAAFAGLDGLAYGYGKTQYTPPKNVWTLWVGSLSAWTIFLNCGARLWGVLLVISTLLPAIGVKYDDPHAWIYFLTAIPFGANLVRNVLAIVKK